MTIFGAILGLLLGAAAGSFIAASRWRLSRGLSIEGRSFCPHCGAEIPGKYNIPIVSYIWLRGKGACCQQPIPKKDFFFEVAGAVVGAALGASGGPLLPSMITLAVIVFFWIADKRLG